ncbi:MAG TPA: DUF177 domain-containing protein [Anaerolineae bacterium]
MSERPVFNVAQLLKEPLGATRRNEIDVRVQDLVPDLAQIEPDADEAEATLRGTVRMMHSTDGVLVQGDLEADVAVPCARCLEPVPVHLDVPVEETFVPTLDVVTGQTVRPEEEDQALWIDEHHILDMSEVLRQDVLVALPMHAVCRSDCKGLCPTCGKNLNEGSCDCQAEPDPRWARLANLLDNDHKPDSDLDKE